MANNLTNTPPLAYPAVSIVIPMYNTEKYVGACLTSILNQTFQNFEVIVVDDCSTDKSCAVVESFIPKFGGRLKLYRSEVNHGPAIPSNRGISLSRGKYVYVVDSDDLILSDALEILVKYAENYNVDMVHMDLGWKFIRNSEKPLPKREDVDIVGWHGDTFVNKPTLESPNLIERTAKLCKNGYGWTAFSKFVKRDLLIENNIIFPDMRTSQDIVWVIEAIFCSKNILTVPNPLYIHRDNLTSNTRTKRTTEQHLHFYLDASVKGMKTLLDFFDTQKFFKENPQCSLAIMDFWNGIHLNCVIRNVASMPPEKIYEILKETFIEKFGDYGNLIAYFCQFSNLMMYRLRLSEQRTINLEKQYRELQLKLSPA